MQTITREQILAIMPLLVEAAVEFRRLANDLMNRLCVKLDVSPNKFTNPSYWLNRFERVGMLDEEWRYGFHGFECHFVNIVTGVDVNVRLGFRASWRRMEFGVLDPWFFYRFLESITKFEDATRLIDNSFQNACDVLDAIAKSGHLKRLRATKHRAGLVARR